MGGPPKAPGNGIEAETPGGPTAETTPGAVT